MAGRETEPREPQVPPFLDGTPHPWATRSFATVLIVLAVVALLASAIVRVPETITAPFELVPLHGADPVRAPRAGSVRQVRTLEGETVAGEAVLFVIGSDLQSDRASGLRSAEARRDGARDGLAHLEAERASQARADAAEIQRLELQIADLGLRIVLEREGLRITGEVVARYKELLARDLVSRTQYADYELAENTKRVELQTLEGERGALVSALEALRNQVEVRRAATAGTQRKLEETLRTAEIEIEGLGRGSAPGGEGDLAVTAPCGGTLVDLVVEAPGSFVQEGDTLAEIACSDRPLRARLGVPPATVARLEPGLGVKLLYDAFPYERYGVRFATLDWVAPASVERDGTKVFPALATIDDTVIRVDGKERPLRAGMGGRALIVVGRRSLLSIAFEPLRRLREATRDAPPRAPGSG